MFIQTAPRELQSGLKRNNRKDTKRITLNATGPKCPLFSQHGHTSYLASLNLSHCTPSSTLSPNHARILLTLPSLMQGPRQCLPPLRPGRLYCRANTHHRSPSHLTPKQRRTSLPTRQCLFPPLPSRSRCLPRHNRAKGTAQLSNWTGHRRCRPCLRHVLGDGLGRVCGRWGMERFDLG